MTKLEPPEGLRELLENAKGRTWINGRSPRMGEGVCLRLTDADLEYLAQLAEKDEHDKVRARARDAGMTVGSAFIIAAALAWLILMWLG